MVATGVSAWWLVSKSLAWTDASQSDLWVGSELSDEPLRRLPLPSGWRGAAYGLFPSIVVVTGPGAVMVANLTSGAATFLTDVQVDAAVF